ncbi:hypothetical protein [Ruegeria arenilitoris]|uniref:hypothetical protein n=1 Tax=Ruegeria arenilitoris TaxID=1173585 RepID=UPI001481B940|nr:hypothetical protein [Ruegeria arenilitoris]
MKLLMFKVPCDQVTLRHHLNISVRFLRVAAIDIVRGKLLLPALDCRLFNLQRRQFWLFYRNLEAFVEWLLNVGLRTSLACFHRFLHRNTRTAEGAFRICCGSNTSVSIAASARRR